MTSNRLPLVLGTLVSLSLSGAGCGSADSSSSEHPAAQDAPLATSCATPANGPVQGVDVSRYQGSFDWAAARAQGIAFGYASIGDGTGFGDPMFAANWANMAAAGVPRGAYQFFEPGDDAATQANLMVQAVGQLGAGDLPCMIDVETAGPNLAAAVQTWVDIVQAGTGKTPIIYTGPYFWEDNVGATNFGNNPLWIADYGPSCPLIPNGWSTWTMWQYSDGGGSLDHDVFNGSLSDLQALGGGGGSCTPQETQDAADFGCACVGGQASGGYCDGTGCTAQETQNAAAFGCACVDHQASGGYCDGTGCTPKETNDAADFGCACVDHQASGGYCDGTGCTAKETNDAAKFGCACVDHQASGGYCAGSGCTEKETSDAAKFGCGCVDHQGAGGACPGTGCTAAEEKACAAKNQTCSLHACT
jgi:lysozyme